MFLPPALLARVLAGCKREPEAGVLGWGGYEAAERQRLLLAPRQLLGLGPGLGEGAAEAQGPDSAPAQTAPWPERPAVAAVSLRGDFLLQALHPSDVTGAVTDLGIGAGAVGDVVAVSERGADLFLLPSVMDDVVARLTHVRRGRAVAGPGLELAAWEGMRGSGCRRSRPGGAAGRQPCHAQRRPAPAVWLSPSRSTSWVCSPFLLTALACSPLPLDLPVPPHPHQSCPLRLGASR